MIAFANMLLHPAELAGMKIPDDYEVSDYPHFAVFCGAQLGSAMPSPSCHWDNAKVVAAIPDDLIMKVSLAELVDRGFSIAFL